MVLKKIILIAANIVETQPFNHPVTITQSKASSIFEVNVTMSTVIKFQCAVLRVVDCAFMAIAQAVKTQYNQCNKLT